MRWLLFVTVSLMLIPLGSAQAEFTYTEIYLDGEDTPGRESIDLLGLYVAELGDGSVWLRHDVVDASATAIPAASIDVFMGPHRSSLVIGGCGAPFEVCTTIGNGHYGLTSMSGLGVNVGGSMNFLTRSYAVPVQDYAPGPDPAGLLGSNPSYEFVGCNQPEDLCLSTPEDPSGPAEIPQLNLGDFTEPLLDVQFNAPNGTGDYSLNWTGAQLGDVLVTLTDAVEGDDEGTAQNNETDGNQTTGNTTTGNETAPEAPEGNETTVLGSVVVTIADEFGPIGEVTYNGEGTQEVVLPGADNATWTFTIQIRDVNKTVTLTVGPDLDEVDTEGNMTEEPVATGNETQSESSESKGLPAPGLIAVGTGLVALVARRRRDL